jgi:hypothetical protein
MKAQAAQIDVIATENFQKASAQTARAKILYARGASAGRIWSAIAKATNHLELAKAQVARTPREMQELLVARGAALSAGARRFAAQAKEIRELDDCVKAKRDKVLADLAQDYRLVEISSVEEARLGHIQRILAQAQDESRTGRKRYAPAVVARAQRAVEMAEAAIVLHPRSSSAYDPYVREAHHATLTLAAMGADRLEPVNGER